MPDQIAAAVNPLAKGLEQHLCASAQELATHWQEQARAVVFRVTDAHPEIEAERGKAIVCALAGVLGDSEWQTEPIRTGWDLGASWFRAGRSLHQLLKEVDLLLAILLYAAETFLAERPVGDAAQGVALARRLHRAVSVLTLAASKGFTQAHADQLRERYRLARHDLRNSIGTIRSAVAFMEDDKVPEDVRRSPRVRAMVSRGATSLDDLVRSQLSDASALTSAFARQHVELSALVWAVRRSVRDEVNDMGCVIDIAGDLPAITTDAAGWELVLRAILLGIVRASPGAHFHLGGEQREAGRITLVVRNVTDGLPGVLPAGVPEFALELAARCGGKVWSDDALRVEIPNSVAHAKHDLTSPGER